MNHKARVGLVHGDRRRSNVVASMSLLRKELTEKIDDRVLVKPNFLSSTNQVASSHVDALRGILDFLLNLDRPPKEVIVAEGANEKYSGEAFANFGYREVVGEYPFSIDLVDLHQTTEWLEASVLQFDGSELSVRVPASVVTHPCTISLAVAKTHDACVVTLGLKNMIMGTMHLDDRIKMHGCQSHCGRILADEVRVLNLNLARLSRVLKPDIAVIDGTIGLQGNGPGGADAVEFGVVATSSDVYAADAVMARTMGFDPAALAQSRYGNLTGSGISDLDEIEILGADLEAVTLPFKPHRTTNQQLAWQDTELERSLMA